MLGAAGHLPPLLSSADARRDFREEGLIEASIGMRVPLGRRTLGLSERVVEVPWVLERVVPGDLSVLDVGSAYAPFVYRRLLCRLPVRERHAVDLAPTALPGVNGHVADARELPFDDKAFDLAICISTLEHIGLDNTFYRGSRELDAGRRSHRSARAPESDARARARDRARRSRPTARELQAIQPFAVDCTGGRRGIHDREDRLFRARRERGWRAADAVELPSRSYGERAPYGAAVICSSLLPGS